MSPSERARLKAEGWTEAELDREAERQARRAKPGAASAGDALAERVNATLFGTKPRSQLSADVGRRITKSFRGESDE